MRNAPVTVGQQVKVLPGFLNQYSQAYTRKCTEVREGVWMKGTVVDINLPHRFCTVQLKLGAGKTILEAFQFDCVYEV